MRLLSRAWAWLRQLVSICGRYATEMSVIEVPTWVVEKGTLEEIG
jgi:hypothetical protein